MLDCGAEEARISDTSDWWRVMILSEISGLAIMGTNNLVRAENLPLMAVAGQWQAEYAKPW